MEKFIGTKTLISIKTWVFAVVAAIGSTITGWIGGWDPTLNILCIFMGADYIMGLIVAAVFKKSSKSETGALESRAAWKGIVKKGITLLIVLLGHQLDFFLGIEYIRQGLIYALLLEEGVSIVEKYALTGRKIPAVFVDALEILRKKGDAHVDSNR